MTRPKNTLSACFVGTLLICAAPAFAQDEASEGWTGEASLTGSKTTGNTDTTDLGLGLKLQQDSALWRHNIYASADFGRADGATNKQRFTLGYKADRNLNDRLYVFGNGDYFSDDFGAYSEGYYLGTGLGYKAIVPGAMGWDLEAGLGYRSQSTQLDITQEEVALRGSSKLTYQFNEAVSLYNNSEVIYASSDTYLWNELGLTATLAGNLAARASFRVDHHTDVPFGTEKTDTITRFGVVYTMD